jgi:thiosulfate/3-mercaptopyruvate sulfurtransferase
MVPRERRAKPRSEPSATPPAFTTLIGTAELGEHLSNPAFVIVDVRHELRDPQSGEKAYEVAHLPGARLAHLDSDH